ncbi:MAG: AarF/UbiB family protein [Rhodospirillales bacterium]|jgi:predicted unusual protein kinase regulating ubiquinone biosynthesis (AarF/ABC1/UbiB family)|nr:ABC transporter ATP-binding protein [Rhodospirillaceae bacterium]MDP6428061.1 AarF/UbiB family protein [Rhodospirillales bacterium]MDP6644217.1 AarF/UbiB family protein [Rhodospirillales bacterium]MDP6843559.1 AarF/UbiB family protein [Rhodospirillales bacterium]
MAERTPIGGRARRYARVGRAVGGLAARLAGERYLGLKIDRLEHAEDLKVALGGLKGPLMKVAQILSTIPDALPREYAAQLAELQSNAPPMGWNFVKRRMAAELGAGWQKMFAEFSHHAAAAASLGQVHRATGPGGEDLACKLQYPDMNAVVEADLRQLKLVFGIYRRYDKAIDPSEVHKELAARLHEELDYRREARHMRLYTQMLAAEPDVHIPQVFDGLCGDRLLTMSWLEGAPLLDYIDAHDHVEDRNRVALNMFRAWYVPLYNYGVIHGDPHLGNYTVRADGAINLMDFGCIRVFKPSFIKGVIDLYTALRDNDPELAVHAYEIWGFTGLSREVIDVLNLWAEFVYAPLLEDRVRPIQEQEGEYGADVAGHVRRELNRVGGVRPPPEFVLMDRAAIGLGSVFTHLGARINWHQLFHDLIDDFDEKVLEKNQNAAFDAIGLKPAH